MIQDQYSEEHITHQRKKDFPFHRPQSSKRKYIIKIPMKEVTHGKES